MAMEEHRLSKIEEDLTEMSKRISTLETGVSDLVSAWRTASGVVSFVKWLASIATALTAIVIFFKTGIIK